MTVDFSDRMTTAILLKNYHTVRHYYTLSLLRLRKHAISGSQDLGRGHSILLQWIRPLVSHSGQFLVDMATVEVFSFASVPTTRA